MMVLITVVVLITVDMFIMAVLVQVVSEAVEVSLVAVASVEVAAPLAEEARQEVFNL